MFSLNLFGSATLIGEDGPVRGRAVQRRRLAVLAVLAVARSRLLGRERIVGLIWPEQPADAARRSLSEALHVLRKDLVDDLFVSSGDEVGLNPAAAIRCDVVEFEEAVEAGEPERAVALYQGPFLDGFYVSDANEFERWADGERQRLEQMYHQALEQLAEKCEEGKDWRGAVELWRKLAVRDPHSSRVALRLMRALEAAGERAAAIQHASVHTAFLREDLDAEPDPEVLALAERLKTQPAPAPVVEPRAATPPPVEPPTADSTIPSTTSTTPAKPAETEAKISQTASRTPPASERVDTPAATATNGERTVSPAPKWDREVREETQPADASKTVITAPLEEPADPETLPRPKRTATVWCADVAGFMDLVAGRPEIGTRLLEVLHEGARNEVHRAGGHLVEAIREEQTVEEGVVAEFDDTREAVRAALQLVQEFQKRIRKAGIQATLQVGVHRGELSTTDDGSVYGGAVEGAAQLERRAEAGQVLATAEVRERLRIAPEMRFTERGTIQLPGRDVPTEVFDVQVERQTVLLSPSTDPDDGTRKHVRTGWAAAAAAGVVVLVLLAMLLRWMQTGVAQPTGGSTPLPPNRIAVLYLEDHSPGGSLGHIAGGFTDQLIDQLAGVEALDVVPRNGVRPFRNSPLPLDSVARALRAGTLIEGSLQQSAGKIRLTIRVVDAAGRQHLFSKTLERPVGELFALQDDLAAEVARFLRKRLGRSVVIERRNVETRSARAKELVFQAEELRLTAYTITTTGRDPLDSPSALRALARADTLLAQAEKLDRRWVEPVVQRAWLAMERYDRAGPADQREHAHVGIRHATRALKIKPDHPGALEVRGLAMWRLALGAPGAPGVDTLVAAAEQDLRTATEADSLRASAWSTLSQLLRSYHGDFMAADLAAQSATGADAYLEREDLVTVRLFNSALMLPDYRRARKYCDEGRIRFPDEFRFVQCQLTLMARDPSERPDPERAWALAAQLDSIDPPDKGPVEGRSYWPVYRKMAVAAVLARAGQKDSARAVMARAHAEASHSPEMLKSCGYDEALVWMALGERERAVRSLTGYLQLHPLLRRYIGRDPAFRPLRGDAAFARITRSRTSAPRPPAARR